MDIIAASLLFVVGLAFGSFLNVCVYRIPRKKSVWSPPSSCPHCDWRIKYYDNIPVLSYILLGGKCRFCRQPISMQYPLIELATAFLFISFYLHYGLTARLLAALFFALVLLLVGMIDLEWQLIPNLVILPALAVSLVLAIGESLFHPGLVPLAGRPSTFNSLGGLLAGGGLLLFIAWVGELIYKKEVMGGGDVKLAAFIGLWLGWYVLLALFSGFLLGSLAGLLLWAVKKKSTKDLISFGPFLVLGSLITLLYGQELFQLYLGTWS